MCPGGVIISRLDTAQAARHKHPPPRTAGQHTICQKQGKGTRDLRQHHGFPGARGHLDTRLHTGWGGCIQDRDGDVAEGPRIVTWSFCCSLLLAGRSYRRLLLSCTILSVLLSQSCTGSALTSKSFIWIFRFYQVSDEIS